jgi:hypothetical protein
MKDVLEKILERELNRIAKASESSPLDIEDCKKLEVLARSYRQFEEKKSKDDNPLEGLSTEDLLEYLKGPKDEQDNPEPKTKRQAKGKRGDTKEGSV